MLDPKVGMKRWIRNVGFEAKTLDLKMLDFEKRWI
jgi:hypothetical protein